MKSYKIRKLSPFKQPLICDHLQRLAHRTDGLINIRLGVREIGIADRIDNDPPLQHFLVEPEKQPARVRMIEYQLPDGRRSHEARRQA